MPLFVSIVASSSVLLFALWYIRSKSQMELRIRSLGQQQRLVIEYQDPFTQRVAFPVVESLVRGLMAIMPTSIIGRARRWLVIAGDKLSLSQFFTIVLITSTLLPAVYFAVAWIASAGSPSVRAMLPVPALAAIGLLAPLYVLRRAAKRRQLRIWRSMPNTFDLLTTCVEAGLSLDFALQRVSERYKGPLSAEIQRTLREVGMGKTRREALTDMAGRVDLPDLHTFVNSIVQAETLGTSVGQVLRAQSSQLRLKRRQRAEQIARQAAVKMVFPLVFFFIPSLFIVMIGPIVLNALDSFGRS